MVDAAQIREDMRTELCTPEERAFLDAMKKTMYVDIPELCPICDYDGLEPKTEALRLTLDKLRCDIKSDQFATQNRGDAD